MSKLVFDATGKYVHPTRYRQIVETASSTKLSSSAQNAISEDQKHSSFVAGFTIKNSDRGRSPAKRMHSSKVCTAKREQSWKRTCAQGFQKI